MKNQEKGAVLAIGLLILLVLTIIGVTAMQVTVLDERIAANAQFKMLTYQASESALAIASSFDSVKKFAEDGISPDIDDYNTDLGGGSDPLKIKAEVLIEDRGEIPLPGSSMSVGRTGAAMLHVYRVTATATLKDSAESIHRLAIGRVVPSKAGR